MSPVPPFLLEQVAALLLFTAGAPLVLWAERRAKAWAQLRRGPGLLQPYRDLRKLLAKRPVAPTGSSALYVVAPWAGLGALLAAALFLPLGDARAAGGAALIAFGLFLTLHRLVIVSQAYDTATPFGGIGSSRELFLGGLGEPLLLLVAAGIYLATGAAAAPGTPLPWGEPSTWLLAGAVSVFWVAEAARIPFDNPATHLELTMVHEAMFLEANGWALALHELGAALKQALVAALAVLLLVPLPSTGPTRWMALLGLVVLASAVLGLVESALAKVRLFRASHLAILAAFLAFLAATTALLGGPPT